MRLNRQRLERMEKAIGTKYAEKLIQLMTDAELVAYYNASIPNRPEEWIRIVPDGDQEPDTRDVCLPGTDLL